MTALFKRPWPLFLLACLFITSSISAQKYLVKGRVLVDGGQFDKLKVDLIYESRSESISVTKDGHFIAMLNWNKIYQFSFQKAGYVSKIIDFSTLLPDNKSYVEADPYELKVRLFPMFDGVDTVFFKNPVAKIRFDKSLNDFASDQDYSLQVLNRIEEMKRKKSIESGKVVKRISEKEEDTLADKLKQENSHIKPTNQDNITLLHQIKEDVPLKEDSLKAWSILPPLEEVYPQGKTVEEIVLPDRLVTRIIIKQGSSQRVFLMVRHNWGGVYCFLHESSHIYLCISKNLFEQETSQEND
ncbi:hypothetical protein DMA11_22030 [Marinilabiliaceae bacterium JC017]|nr:hypothetical protein DMA11_22030 [Marinilabiliaceae bacterium JC017]